MKKNREAWVSNFQLRAGKPISSLIAQACGAIAGAFGLLAFAGWVLDLRALTSLGQGWIPMAPSTALLFVLFGTVAFFGARVPVGRAPARTGVAVAAAGALIALLLLILSYLGIRLEAEHLGFTIAGAVGEAPIGHISPATALCFLLAGLSLVATLTSASGRHAQAMTAFWLAGVLVFTSVVFLLAYLFGTPLLYGGKFIPPALTTSIALAALGAALLALAGPRAWATDREIDAETVRTSISFVIVFALMTIGLVAAGGVYFRDQLAQHRAEIERQLSAIADLKVSELLYWRDERFGDAMLLHGNIFFADLVRRAFGPARDAEARYHLHNWLRQIREAYGYSEIALIDAQGVARFSIPDKSFGANELENARQALRSGRVSLEDFHQDEPGGAPHLSLLVPILDEAAGGRPLGLVMLGIDPAKYLYPLIGRWPTPSSSSETLLVRRDGDDVLYLNELRFRKDTALALRYPLTRTEKPAVRAVLGHEGILEGTDYHGVPIIAATRAVPGTPWFLITRMATDEFLASIEESLWLTAAFVAALLLSCGAALGLIWRHQRVHHYKERTRAAEALAAGAARLARQKDLYNMLSQTNQAIVRMTRREELFPAVCRIAVEFGRFRFAWIGLIDEDDKHLRLVAHAGVEAGYVQQQVPVSIDAADFAGRGPAGQAFRTGHGAVSNDFLNDPATAPWHEVARRAGVRSSAAFPIRERRAIEGILILAADEPGFFTDDLLPTLEEMAVDVSFALDNFRQSAELAQAVEALRASETNYRQLFAANPHPMWVYDLETLRFLAVNDAAVTHYGYTRDEFAAMTIADIRPEAEVPRLVQNVARVEEGRVDEAGIWQHRKKDGTLIDVEITSHMLDFAGRRAEVVLAHDVTERTQAEKSLRAAEDQFRSLVEQSIAGIYIIQEGRLAYVNPRFAEIFGYGSAEEPIGRDALSVIAESERAAVGEKVRKWYESAARSMEYSTTGLRKDGSTVEVGVHGARASHHGRGAIIGMIQDISEKRRAEQQIQHYIAQLQKAFMHTVEVATTLSEMRDPYTAGHERRVAEIAVAIGGELGLDEGRLEGLRVAGYLHDIGKMTVPAEILSKPGKLTSIERQLIQQHSQASYDVLKNVEFPWPVAEIALQHHERMDGSGYPRGLKGEAIVLEARILAVADTVEAMSSHRPYRPGLGIDQALGEIERGRGSVFDPAVADACLRLFRERGYSLPA
ncbi:MAG: PAS domain S-box protein [Betaproteobacteria bacterium]|nr:PAS domain S-box protein [Betaproteobacteria bacterium]